MRRTVTLVCALVGTGILAGCTPADDSEPFSDDVEWRHYGNDPGGTKYSHLDDIHRGNVGSLEVAWVARAGDFSPETFEQGVHVPEGAEAAPVDARAAGACGTCHGMDIRFETTPLMRNGSLYVSTPANRVLALDPATGSERWAYDPGVDREQDYSEDLISRGVSGWDDPRADPGTPCRSRIYLATIDARLISLDGKTGEPCTDFGDNGQVALGDDVALGGRAVDAGQYLVTSPPAVVGDVLVVGSAIGDNRRRDVESGVVRAFDARNGGLLWSFDPIPRTAEHPAWSAWTEEAARTTGAANVWSVISADPVRDLVFLPTGSAAPDFYGGERPGRNDFANSVVALRGSTGELVWSFQVVHHDVWDYDVPAQPVLLNVTIDDRSVPAVAVGTKMGHVFVLDRESGEPLFPVEERAVPQDGVPGEQLWPTQPFPLKPPPLHETALSPDDAFGPTEEDRAFCRDWIERLRYDGIFTPPSLEGTLMWPGFGGGINWDGMAWDPELGILVIPMKRLAMYTGLHPRAAFQAELRERREGMEYASQAGTPYGMSRMPLIGPSGVPCSPPPWSKLIGVELETGRVAWERPLGRVRTPDGSGLAPEAWGSLAFGGPLTTGGGVTFIAAGMADYFRAFDTRTGELLWERPLPAGGQAAPMTYRYQGRQYVVIAAGGRAGIGTPGDYIVAFALP